MGPNLHIDGGEETVRAVKRGGMDIPSKGWQALQGLPKDERTSTHARTYTQAHDDQWFRMAEGVQVLTNYVLGVKNIIKNPQFNFKSILIVEFLK